ncbi:MAG: 6-phosphofructokinase [Anaerotignum sp.]|nr:6-phosphofructokinase [Anaerotignum sp.]MCI8868519.1 6-phosphofructokinase [Anaerotignum sp.]
MKIRRSFDMEEQKKIKKIGVLTSGGDAPGMNAAIRAVVRTGRYFDLNVIGIRKGYNGLINGEIKEMYSRDVSNVMNLGGTILHTARCPEMMTPEGLDKAAAIYKILSLDALIVIGGDGSYRGMAELAKRGVNCVGIPATIDLDMNNTEYTIGFDTAVNTGMDALNKLRDTSSSHERCSVVEVMGRDAGYIAVWCGMVGGAEDVMFPEEKDTIDSKEVIQQILANRSTGKRHNLIVVAEGVGGTQKLAKDIQEITGIQTRATILGHLQRGGSPTAIDRMHASMMGYHAVKALLEGRENIVIAYNKGQYEVLDLFEALDMKKSLDKEIYDVVKILSI